MRNTDWSFGGLQSIVGGMTAVASLGTQCCARRRTATAMKFFMIWDLLPVAVLFLVGMALVAAVLGQQEAWSLPGVVPNLYRGAFAGGLILL